MQRILVIAAHPDDEILGCGGTMAAHAQVGDAVHVALMAQGLAARGDTSAEAFAQHQAAAQRANAVLGVQSVHFGGFADNAMDSVPLLHVARAIEALVAQLQPTTIYTHHPGDLNVDHRVVSEATAIACRPQPGCGVDQILFFEVASSTEWRLGGAVQAFAPNWYRDITAQLDTKIAALRQYDHEMRTWPHARSYEAVSHLARWRGATIGAEAAEAFMLGRKIQR